MHTQHSRFRIATPFTALWQWLMTQPGQPGPIPCRQMTMPADLGIRVPLPRVLPSDTTHSGSPAGARQPLRVLRVMDADLAPAQIGRLRISGRMADVCAELDRLAAHEAMFH